VASGSDPNRVLDQEALFLIAKLTNCLYDLARNSAFNVEYRTGFRFFKELVSRTQIPFYGEPLSGLQIMGILETRTLDFKRVIYTSVNEGVLPKSKSTDAFIPFDIRKQAGLPTHHDREALFAYHFYRLLQAPDKIDLLYSVQATDFKPADSSRYLRQLEWEWRTKNPRVKWQEHATGAPLRAHGPGIEIEKTPDVLEDVRAYLEKGISPSGLNTFLESPLDFYYQYVIGIRESEEPEEDIAANTFGDIIHNVLETLYSPFVGAVLTTKNLAEMKSAIRPELEKHYKKKFGNSYKYGRTLISFHVAESFVKDVVAFDRKHLESGFPITLLGLEERLTGQITVDGMTINFKGFADRIDRTNGVVRIIDYKSGKVDPLDVTVDNLSSEKLRKKPKAIQLLLYADMYRKAHPEAPEIRSSNLSFRNMKAGLLTVSSRESGKKQPVSEANITDFEEVIETIIREIMNPEVPFTANPDYAFTLLK
jgi:hypothetical protein